MTGIGDMQFRYFFDPLCGWCYASAPALAALAEQAGGRLDMMPSGLFAAPRPTASIADHAWHNDQRIASMTGQPFSEAYHQRVLQAPGGVFDSSALTHALVALGEWQHGLEPRFLHQAQIARYVGGEDTSDAMVVARIAASVADQAGIALDVAALADRLRHDADLHARTDARIAETQRAMAALRISGVPQLVAIVGGRHVIVRGDDIYAGGDRLLTALAALDRAA
ncbi:putative protein-disulfide isomerase [Sphingomonas sp. SORGH_AS870]|uniref:DsbA family protein n=1 Tax=Sphingomonas sp. SORGH_AS_0870 TaxID=3041801 RepID=UPI0028624265|nr:DsbA family protein [Sphingomonas sp. SORGH_AS_0870]MDR6145832.1 putative protein-disulfide isomerase [Sphingomonas sp. SORGH_AS_0870]